MWLDGKRGGEGGDAEGGSPATACFLASFAGAMQRHVGQYLACGVALCGVAV